MLYFITAIFIVCAILYIAAYLLTPDATALAAASNGTFDGPARAALESIGTAPTPRERLTRARIYEFNVPNSGGRNMREEVAAEYFTALEEADEGMQREILEDIMQFAIRAPMSQMAATAATLAPAAEPIIAYPADPQNVHDSKVNVDLARNLAAFEPPPRDFIADARKYIEENLRGTDAANAMFTLDKIAEGNHISTFGRSERQIFNTVWARCEHPANTAANRNEDCKRAVASALADSASNGSLVCANGRCGRIINSLAFIDFDPEITAAKTFAVYKNQIYEESAAIMRKTIENADETVRAGYENDDAAATKIINDAAAAQIESNIQSYDNLSAAEKAILTKDCLAAI